VAGAQATAGKEEDIEASELGKATRSLKKQKLPAILSAVVHGVTVISIHCKTGVGRSGLSGRGRLAGLFIKSKGDFQTKPRSWDERVATPVTEHEYQGGVRVRTAEAEVFTIDLHTLRVLA
jgi:hypothetical protein